MGLCCRIEANFGLKGFRCVLPSRDLSPNLCSLPNIMAARRVKGGRQSPEAISYYIPINFTPIGEVFCVCAGLNLARHAAASREQIQRTLFDYEIIVLYSVSADRT